MNVRLGAILHVGKDISLFAVVTILIASPCASFAQTRPQHLTSTEIDQIVDHLQAAVQNYIFPDVATRLRAQIEEQREEYRRIGDPAQLAKRLTADMRAVGHDFHLQVTYGEELAVRKQSTLEERQHAHAYDVANGYGLRSARRLPGNIGYVDLAYFSPDADAGVAVAAGMQLVSGTDALIVDLRRNGGGSGDTERTLISYFFEGQLSSVEQRVHGHIEERQHWTVPYVQGPRYVGRPLYILTSQHTHSAAEVLAYDLKNQHLATIIGEHTSGDATSSSGEEDLGYGFSAFIADGEVVSPITHTNYIKLGVQPDVATEPTDALAAAYVLALKTTTSIVDSEDLKKERESAMHDPKAALLQEVDGFRQK